MLVLGACSPTGLTANIAKQLGVATYGETPASPPTDKSIALKATTDYCKDSAKTFGLTDAHEAALQNFLARCYAHRAFDYFNPDDAAGRQTLAQMVLKLAPDTTPGSILPSPWMVSNPVVLQAWTVTNYGLYQVASLLKIILLSALFTGQAAGLLLSVTHFGHWPLPLAKPAS